MDPFQQAIASGMRQPQALRVASPLNNVQVIALLAAMVIRDRTVKEAVALSIDIIAESIAQEGSLTAKVREMQGETQ